MIHSQSLYQRGGKRLFDLALTVLLLTVWLIFVAVIALIVRLRLGRPVLFKQERLGLGGQSFFIRKFRTMTNAGDVHGNLLPDAERLTDLGSFLRATSLDELPELINVLTGEMSLVGPRPLYAHYRGRYTREQFRRHEAVPGITGWAQINGRNAVGWVEKFELDVWYVDHLSFWLDLKILSITLWKAFKREDINQPGQATVEEFMGTPGKQPRHIAGP
ncbi:MAG TPA: sugar transferase [Blastocatellia bacterium]|nr:sugar transferase [Blastocatellia bacterium]